MYRGETIDRDTEKNAHGSMEPSTGHISSGLCDDRSRGTGSQSRSSFSPQFVECLKLAYGYLLIPDFHSTFTPERQAEPSQHVLFTRLLTK